MLMNFSIGSQQTVLHVFMTGSFKSDCKNMLKILVCPVHPCWLIFTYINMILAGQDVA